MHMIQDENDAAKQPIQFDMKWVAQRKNDIQKSSAEKCTTTWMISIRISFWYQIDSICYQINSIC